MHCKKQNNPSASHYQTPVKIITLQLTINHQKLNHTVPSQQCKYT